MNNRIREKRYKKNILLNVRSVKPIAGDFIVVRYPMREMSCVEVCDIAKFVQSNFKKNKVFFIPDSLSINTMTEKDFKAMLNNLDTYRTSERIE